MRYRFDKAETHSRRSIAISSAMKPITFFYSRNFARKRQDEQHMNRLYIVESTYTVAGTMADHRYRLAASQIGDYLVARFSVNSRLRTSAS